VANWLLWWSLIRAGEASRAAQIRRETLGQLSEGGFAEYFEPFTGEPLGSQEQSWTAAIALDMLAVQTSGGS
jgi:glucosylglycerate hydrolase